MTDFESEVEDYIETVIEVIVNSQTPAEAYLKLCETESDSRVLESAKKVIPAVFYTVKKNNMWRTTPLGKELK